MPGRDGTGPRGRRAMCRMGSGMGARPSADKKESLTEQKELLQNRLDNINKQLTDLSETNK